MSVELSPEREASREEWRTRIASYINGEASKLTAQIIELPQPEADSLPIDSSIEHIHHDSDVA